MTAALQQLSIIPDYLLLDAMQLDVLIEQKSLINGDARSVSIAAASILAKTHRDTRMEEWDAVYPQYGLAQHKGYATAEHLEALREHGPSPLHRNSFAPVRDSRCWSVGATQTPLPALNSLRKRRRNSFLRSFATSSPPSFPSRTGITACSQPPARSLTCLFPAC